MRKSHFGILVRYKNFYISRDGMTVSEVRPFSVFIPTPSSVDHEHIFKCGLKSVRTVKWANFQFFVFYRANCRFQSIEFRFRWTTTFAYVSWRRTWIWGTTASTGSPERDGVILPSPWRRWNVGSAPGKNNRHTFDLSWHDLIMHERFLEINRMNCHEIYIY